MEPPYVGCYKAHGEGRGEVFVPPSTGSSGAGVRFREAPAHDQVRVQGKSRGMAGVMLIECLVYIAVFALLTSIGLAAFYLCWDHSKALIYATEDIHASLLAGEHWRADVRGAAGKITLEPTATGEALRVPQREQAVVYRFEGGEVRREIPERHTSDLLVARTKASHMSLESRAGVAAWRWELQLASRRSETQLPLLFTFEAVQTNP